MLLQSSRKKVIEVLNEEVPQKKIFPTGIESKDVGLYEVKGNPTA